MLTDVSSFSMAGRFVQPRVDFSLRSRIPIEPTFDWGFDLDLPFEHLGVFARHIDTAAPITRLPMFALATFALTRGSHKILTRTDLETKIVFPRIPLGVVGTDHVGYGSFDLWPLRQVQVMQAIKEALTASGLLKTNEKPRLAVGLAKLLVMPFKDPTIAFDALTEGDCGPNVICLRMDIDAAMLEGRAVWPQMPAMQTPGIRDWRLSPGSFSMSGALLIGEDGCETLLPSNLATKMIRFRQFVRTTARWSIDLGRDDRVRPRAGAGFGADFLLGYCVQYQTEWFPLGHSLGQISYSLPLAPGEKIKIAIIDWSRREAAKRNENTTEKEDLLHAALRDRSLTESISMVVQESQSGSSFMAGAALSAGVGIPIGAVSIGAGAALGIGGASSDSQGMRTVVEDTTQKISDAFHQATSVQRELNSTVIVQSEQAEMAQARTRTIANYNHSHALTILYYEVLQHHRLLTRPASLRSVIFLKYPTPEFTYESIEIYRTAISSALLDDSVRSCLDIVSKRACLELNLERAKKKQKEQGDPLDNLFLDEITVEYTTSDQGPIFPVKFSIIPQLGGTPISCTLIDQGLAYFTDDYPPPTPGGWEPPTPTAPPAPTRHVYPDLLRVSDLTRPVYIPANSQYVYKVKPSSTIRWKNVLGVEIAQVFMGTTFNGVTPDWTLKQVRVTTSAPNPKGIWEMVNLENPGNVPWDHTKALRLPVKGFVPPIEDVEDLLSDDERCCLRRLVLHLNSHAAYYWRAIWLAEKAADRVHRLEGMKIGNLSLFDLVENTVYDFVDGYAVMPIAAGAEEMMAELFKVKNLGIPKGFSESIEQIITTPARGVFAEAKLGHCNASEVIDPTRFWDWQTSPIPDEPPIIAPTSTDTRATDPTKGLAPTAFPPSIVNIVNPQALPDPTGMNAGAAVMAALGPFRDMSGMKELGPFLQTLSNNATQLASQGLKNAQGGAQTAGQTAGMMNAIRSATELPPEKRADLISELLTGQVKANSMPPQNPSSTTSPGTGPISGTGSSSTTPSTPSGTGPSTPPVPIPGGTPSTGPAVPTPSNPSSPPAPAQPQPQPKPIPAPTPQRSPTLSSKMKLIVFTFSYDTNDIMLGRWKVVLTAPGHQEKIETRLINTLTGASGVDIGNRLEFYLEESFGNGDADVNVQVSGTIVGVPQTIGAGVRGYEVRPWTLVTRDFTSDINRNVFAKVRTIRIVQPTEVVKCVITRSVTDSSSDITITGRTSSLEIGVENATEVGGSVGVGSAKETIKMNAKGTYGLRAEDQNVKQVGNGYIETVEFNGRKVTDASPNIIPLV